MTPDAKGLEGACHIFLRDLEELPEEAFCKKFNPTTRTVADIVYEVNLVNDHVGMVVRGEEPFAWPDGTWIVAPDGFDKKEIILEAFKASSSKIKETFEKMTVDELQSMVETEHGDRTKSERCRFVTVHLWYHSGQLNFVQTLMGDDGWHW